jgi:hypothetical protein
MADPATWNRKYCDLAEQFFWAPQYIGMRSIPQRLWQTDGDRVSVPRELVSDADFSHQANMAAPI